MSNTIIKQAAERLFQAYQSRSVCEPVRELIGESDLATAYQVQAEVNQSIRNSNGGNALIGRKAAVTAFAGQKNFGISHPLHGSLFQNMELDTNIPVNYANFNNPKIEVEIAFILKKNINNPVSTAQLIQAIDWVAPAFEIVGSRMAWDIKVTDMVADAMGASHFSLGHHFKKIQDVDFANCIMSLHRDDELITEGSGGACIGSPLNSLHWLVNALTQHGQGLSSGETIIAGALAPFISLETSGKYEGRISGLGNVKMEVCSS